MPAVWQLFADAEGQEGRGSHQAWPVRVPCGFLSELFKQAPGGPEHFFVVYCSLTVTLSWKIN